MFSCLQCVAQNPTHAFLDGPSRLPHPPLRAAVSSCSRQPQGRKGGGALAGCVRPSLAQRARGSPKGPERGAAALPPPRPSLCLPRRTAGSAPPQGGPRPSEDAHRGEQARSRWPRPGATGGGKSELEPGSRSQRGGGWGQSAGMWGSDAQIAGRWDERSAGERARANKREEGKVGGAKRSRLDASMGGVCSPQSRRSRCGRGAEKRGAGRNAQHVGGA